MHVSSTRRDHISKKRKVSKTAEEMEHENLLSCKSSIKVHCGQCGQAYSIHSLYFCSVNFVPVCPHPTCSRKEIETYYCPVTLENVPSSDADSIQHCSTNAYGCPRCENNLQVKTGKVKENESGDSLFLFCTHCRWSSKDLGISVASSEKKEDLYKVANEQEKSCKKKGLEIFSKAVDFYRTHYQVERLNKASPSVRSKIGRFTSNLNRRARGIKVWNGDAKLKNLKSKSWKWDQVEEHLKKVADLQNQKVNKRHFIDDTDEVTKANQNSLQSKMSCPERWAYPSLMGSGKIEKKMYPKRKPLRIKYSVRCGNSGKLILKPEFNPLHGDSSFRTSVGQWFKIHSLSRLYLPRITLLSMERLDDVVDDQKCSFSGFLKLKLTSPAPEKQSPIEGQMSVLLSSYEDTPSSPNQSPKNKDIDIVKAEVGSDREMQTKLELPKKPIFIGAFDDMVSQNLSPQNDVSENQPSYVVNQTGHTVTLKLKITSAKPGTMFIPLKMDVKYAVPTYIKKDGEINFSCRMDMHIRLTANGTEK